MVEKNREVYGVGGDSVQGINWDDSVGGEG